MKMLVSIFENVSFNWSAADWPAYAEYCSDIDWHAIFSNCATSNDCWDIFMDALNVGNNKFVPRKNVPCDFKIQSEPRFIANLLLKKSQLWRLSKDNPCKTNTDKYKQCVN